MQKWLEQAATRKVTTDQRPRVGGAYRFKEPLEPRH